MVLVVRLSQLLASEVMVGLIRHVTVMGTTTQTACAPPLAIIEIVILGRDPLEYMVDAVMVALLVVVTALYMEIMAAMVVAVEVKGVQEVETSIVSEAQTIAIVGVIVLVVKSSKRCLHLVQDTLSTIPRFHQITSKVNLPMAPCMHVEVSTDSRIVLSRTLFVGGVT